VRGEHVPGPAEIVGRGSHPQRVEVDPVDAGGVGGDDLALRLGGELRVAELLAPGVGDLERPERVERGLGRAVPDRIRSPDDVLLTEVEQQLAEGVGG
jgi:hypothetical protein